MKYTLPKLLLFYLFCFFIDDYTLMAQGEFVVEFNLENNSYSKVSNQIDDVMYVVPGFNTYDENNGIFYFMSSQPKRAIYGIDIINGEVKYTIDAKDIKQIEYSKELNKLFCIQTDQLNDKKYFGIVDLGNGEVKKMGLSIPSSSSYQGYDAFNEKDKYFTFIDPSNTIYSIDATTGNIVYSPKFVNAQGTTLQSFDYHPVTGVLYCNVTESNGTSLSLGKIDISTGLVTLIGNKNNIAGNFNSCSIDAKNDQMLIHYLQNGKDFIISLDLLTGQVVYNNEIILEGLDNLIDIEYDNVRNKLFSKHWDAMITSNKEEQIIEGLNIYYDAFSNSLCFKNSDFDLSDYKGKICDLSNQIFYKEFKFENSSIKLPDLPAGIYIIYIMDNSKGIGYQKFFIP